LFDDFVSDTVGWIEMLRKDKRFSTVSVLGHSQGSLVGAIACRKAKVSSFISIAGAGKPIQQVLRDQLGPKLAGDLKTQAFEIIDQLAKGQTVSTIPKELQTIFRPSVQQFISSWMKYDPVKEVAELKVPALIVNGTTDIQIGVEDAKLLADANKLARLAVIKDMNHVLTICKTPEEQLKTYADPKRPIAAELVQELSSFLNEFSGD
jgi:pimeloyl-ACP methyl ester carboxylesterase